MSAYKKLNRQDVFISDYTAKKQWNVQADLVGEVDYGIEVIRGFSGSIPGYPYPLDYRNNRYESLVYRSVNHNYYADSIGEGLFSGSRDLSLQTTRTLSGSRDIKTEVTVISLPKAVYGIHIEPYSITLEPVQEVEYDNYTTGGYCQDILSGVDEYIEEAGYLYGSNFIDTQDYLEEESLYVTESVPPGVDYQYVDIDKGQQRIEIIDDGNGCLILSGSEKIYTQPRRVVGDVIYNQGQIIITDPIIARYYSTYSRVKLKWKSNQPIYTYNVHCKIRSSDLNFTYNRTAQTGSYGQLANNVTGSNFTPYITTVGLYNDANELIAVAKTNKPVPKVNNVDITFVVKIDI